MSDDVTMTAALLQQAMHDIAGSCRALLVSPPAGGAELADILTAYQFKEIMGRHGLAIVPQTPKPAMRLAWRQDWFRSFSERYHRMLLAVWSVQKSSNQPHGLLAENCGDLRDRDES